eukprot:TRINITY_DN28882_c0_g1_i2.p1 TRINITY_DN28882_c0_g1~~TRINITY_DN28882_c0_g1_i2.p1  ORF type:complete len:741 (+),score=173.57 TRINITY_DN28882_c0_g1_i2:63-2225(+)
MASYGATDAEDVASPVASPWRQRSWLSGTSRAFSAGQPLKKVYRALFGEPSESEWRSAVATGDTALARIAWEDAVRSSKRRDRRKTLAAGALVTVLLLSAITATRPGVRPQALVTLGTMMIDLVLIWVEYPPHFVFLYSSVFLALTGCVDTRGALEGFANEGVMAIAALLALAKATYDSGAVSVVMRHVLGSPSTSSQALCRLLPPLVLISAFLNNTPVVAILIPELRAWGERCGIGVGKLLMPLSFGSILGGGLTLIGSSINIIAASVATRVPGGPSEVPVFSLLPIGAVQAVLGAVYLVLVEPLLPEGPREEQPGCVEAGTAADSAPSPRQTRLRSYTVTLRVHQGSPLVGLSAAAAGLTRVAGVLQVVSVRPSTGAEAAEEVLQAGSTLRVEALAAGVVGVRRTQGLSLEPATGLADHGDLASWPRRRHRILVEAVAGRKCAWLQRKPYEGAVPLAVSGDDGGKDTLAAGDCVLCECFPKFAAAYGVLSDHFVLLLPVPDSKPPRTSFRRDAARVWTCAAVIAVMMGAAAASVAPLFFLALAAVLALIAVQCVTAAEAWGAVDGTMLCTIAAAFGVSNAMQQSGAAELGAEALVALAGSLGGSRLVVMLLIYTMVTLLSAVVSSNAVVVLMMPVVFKAKANADPLSSPLPYVLLVIFAASANFATPFAYQTNMLVWRPGGYSFSDFVRVGVGLQVVCLVVAVSGCYASTFVSVLHSL